MAQTTHEQQEGPRVQATPKRVRALLHGRFIADTKDARIVGWGGHPRSYAVPRDDIVAGVLMEVGGVTHHPDLGSVREAVLRVDGKRVQGAAFVHEGGSLDAYVTLDWDKMHGWYEESEQVLVHPRDPQHRVDVLMSERHVVVEVGGVAVAESQRPVTLFETGLPVRYYLPPTDVRLDLLTPSDTTTHCPYKGRATYHHVDVGGERHKDLVWCYKRPLVEALKVQGLLCFYNERADLTVDGEPQERPDTPWKE